MDFQNLILSNDNNGLKKYVEDGGDVTIEVLY